jgi:hypothetical protein
LTDLQNQKLQEHSKAGWLLGIAHNQWRMRAGAICAKHGSLKGKPASFTARQHIT